MNKKQLIDEALKKSEEELQKSKEKLGCFFDWIISEEEEVNKKQSEMG